MSNSNLEATSQPRQFILKDAVELLYNKLNHTPKVEVKNEKPESSTTMAPVSNLLQNFGKDSVEVLVSLELSKTLEMIGVNLSGRILHKCVCEYGEDVMLNAATQLKTTGVLANKENPTGYFLGCLKNGMGQTTKAQKPSTMYNASQGEDEPHSQPNCSTSEMGQTMKPVVSFSHAETNPRVTVASLIIDGQYQRAATVAGLYGVDYQELVHECGVADDPNAMIMVRKVTR